MKLGTWVLGLVVLTVVGGLLTVDCRAIDPYVGEQGERGATFSYFGTVTDPTDTIWHPGHEVLNYLYADSVNVPNVWGINLTQYKYLGFEVVMLQADTTLNDTLLVDVWTGYYGHLDSLISAVAYTEITDGLIFDTCITPPECPIAKKWVILADTSESPDFWFQKYAWLRLRTHMATIFATDTTFTGATDGDTWSEAGDSLADWNTTNAADIFWKMFTVSANYDSFAYVQGKDSLFALSLNTMTATESPGTIDSVTFAVAYWESLTTVAEDTLRLGIAFGDTSLHHYDSLDTPANGGSGVLWSTQQALDSSGTAEQRDTVYFTFTTDPYGNTWTRTSLDSCIVIFDPVHVDTTGAGTEGILCVYRFWSTTYHSRTELFPALKYRATVYLKE